MKKIVICIPTYNRFDIVNKWLEEEIDIMRKYNIDLIFYDSSSDDKVINLLNYYMENGNVNISYKRIDSNVDGNKKALMIYEDSEKWKQYEYIWMMHDHTIYNEKAIKTILDDLDKDADLYAIDVYTKDYNFLWLKNHNEFLIECAYFISRYGACIVNRKRIIEGTDWKFIKEKYLNKETISMCHVGFYFEKVAQIKNPKIGLIKIPYEYVHMMKVSDDGKRSWYAKTVRVIAGCWYETIKRLPEVYLNKSELYRKEGRNHISKYTMFQYKKEKGFSFTDYVKYREGLKKISPDEVSLYFWIAVLPVNIGKKIVYRDLKKRILSARNIGKKIVIYGAGIFGKECASLLKDADIEFDGFLVTSIKNNKTEFMGYPVYEAKEYLEKNEAYIIISVISYSTKDIENYLEKLKESSKPFNYIYIYEQ